jgi:hypothetical protein
MNCQSRPPVPVALKTFFLALLHQTIYTYITLWVTFF